ncbi:S8 family serine peptidase [Desulforhabdus sp. TSK]|uniref:subtilisin-like serine protease QhpE n=1 Tax=Desulforhabdus sp. TSK TaxID=2925014 RepID=UPI001FC856BA|nr:S8 family serine peptidase [Desulforhabdus sp. TSK]GKT09214.1 hypothetical protein DSTSK_25190 [Desulforhabdus sp. TSK]
MPPISIAIIDSRVNPGHSHVGHVEDGASFLPRSPGDGTVARSPDFRDEIGHGTAIAGIIREKAPHARFHAAKIFAGSLRASMAALLAALEWAVEQNAKIIHLSLGTRNERFKEVLEPLCRSAFERGTILVAAATAADALIWPAVLDTVIGVYWNALCDEETLIHHPDNPVEFGAHGLPRPIPGRPQELNFRGSSFAAARVTARIAELLVSDPDMNCQQARSALAHLARIERLPFLL